MGTEVEEKRQTSNWSIVIRILRCDIVNVIRVHIHGRVVVYITTVRLRLVLLCFLDATAVLHLRELFQP